MKYKVFIYFKHLSTTFHKRLKLRTRMKNNHFQNGHYFSNFPYNESPQTYTTINMKYL